MTSKAGFQQSPLVLKNRIKYRHTGKPEKEIGINRERHGQSFKLPDAN
jgi:hypothetical protein